MDSLEKLVKEIAEGSGKSQSDIIGLIEEKEVELSGLVSKEGAAYIVGRELGVSLLKETSKQLKAKNILPGMRSVDFLGRITRIMEPRDFERNGKQGRVQNLFLGDDSGSIRMSLWDKETDSVGGESGLKEGDVVRITNAWVKKDNRDSPEIRLGKRGKMQRVEDDSLPSLDEMKPPGFGDGPAMPMKRVSISDLKDGDFGEIRGSLVQVFRRRPFFNVCPNCDGKLTDKEGKLHCQEHGPVEPKRQLILSGVVDDGTGNIRVVLFRDQAQKIVGRSPEELVKEFEGKEVEQFYEEFPALGKEFVIKGRVRVDSFTENLELIGNDVAEADVKSEAEGLAQELGSSGTPKPAASAVAE